MTKRSQTTGLPKTAPKRTGAEPAEGSPTPQRKLSRREEYHSRAEREAQLQRRIVLGIVALAAALAVIIVVAVVIDQIIIPGQVVAVVEGKNITVADFQKRVRFERATRIQQLISGFNTYQSFGIDPQQLLSQDPYRTWMSDLDIPAQLGTTVINDMVEDQLVRNEAAARNLTVTQEDIQKQIEQYFGFNPEEMTAAEATAEVTATVEPTATPTPFVSPTPSPTPTITPTPELTATVTPTPFPTIPPEPTLTGTQQYEQFQTNRIEYFNTMRRDARLSDGDINTFFELRALREKLRDAVTADITKNAPFVDARHILVATEEEAQDVIKALENGESFAELARAISTDTGSGANGGELGWAPIYQYVKPFADAVRDAEIGAIVGPVQSEFGYHIIQVRARENRDMTDDQLENAKNGVFAEWLKAQQESKQDQISINEIWSNYVPDDPPSPFRTE